MNAGDRAPIVITLHGETTEHTARRLAALAESLIVADEPALAIDCTAAAGLSGHLLGALRRVAAAASRHGVAVGVVVGHADGNAIRCHTPSMLTAPTSARVLDALGSGRTALRIALVTRPRDDDRAAS